MHTRKNDDFASLIPAARRSEPHALEAVVASCYPRVEQLVHAALAKDLRAGRGWLSTRFSTGDIVQDVFYALLRDLDRFTGTTRDELISYLATTARHRILDRLRFHEAECRDGSRTQPVPSSLDPEARGTSPLESAQSSEEVRRLQELVGTLEPRQQETLRIRLQERATFQEIADRLGFASMAVARRAYYAATAVLAVKLGSAPFIDQGAVRPG